MKIFDMQTDLISYKYPLLKIIVCLFMYPVLLFRNHIFHITNKWLNLAFTIVSVILVIGGVLCLYISVFEIFETYSNRKESKKGRRISPSKKLSIEEIVDIARRDDIVEIEIVCDGAIVKIGASSDAKPSKYVFFDKRYYIGVQEYDTIEAFQERMVDLQNNGYIDVLSIDGVPVAKMK